MFDFSVKCKSMSLAAVNKDFLLICAGDKGPILTSKPSSPRHNNSILYLRLWSMESPKPKSYDGSKMISSKFSGLSPSQPLAYTNKALHLEWNWNKNSVADCIPATREYFSITLDT